MSAAWLAKLEELEQLESAALAGQRERERRNAERLAQSKEKQRRFREVRRQARLRRKVPETTHQLSAFELLPNELFLIIAVKLVARDVCCLEQASKTFQRKAKLFEGTLWEKLCRWQWPQKTIIPKMDPGDGSTPLFKVTYQKILEFEIERRRHKKAALTACITCQKIAQGLMHGTKRQNHYCPNITFYLQ